MSSYNDMGWLCSELYGVKQILVNRMILRIQFFIRKWLEWRIQKIFSGSSRQPCTLNSRTAGGGPEPRQKGGVPDYQGKILAQGRQPSAS